MPAEMRTAADLVEGDVTEGPIADVSAGERRPALPSLGKRVQHVPRRKDLTQLASMLGPGLVPGCLARHKMLHAVVHAR